MASSDNASPEINAHTYAQEVELRLRRLLQSDSLLVQFMPFIQTTVTSGDGGGLIGMEITLRRTVKAKSKLKPTQPA
jgi:hypothetical protein